MKFYLKRIRINSQGYEAGKYGKYGKYHGIGIKVYRYETSPTPACSLPLFDGEMIASDREDAKNWLKRMFGEHIKFFN